MANKATGKRYGLLQKIEEPTKPWEVINMDFVTGLPAGGKENYDSSLVLCDRLTKKCKFVKCHKEDTAFSIAMILWSTVIVDIGFPRIIISDRDPKFTSDLWISLHKLYGTTLAFSTAYHPQTDGLAERMIQTLEDMIRRYCSFGIEYKDDRGFTYDWVMLLPALEMAYNSSVHSTTGRTPYELERGWIPSTPKDLIPSNKLELHPKAVKFHEMINESRKFAAECVKQAVEYNKERWDKTHKEPTFKPGDLILISTINFNNLEGPRKLRPPFVGPFVVKRLHGKNAIEVIPTGFLEKKHHTFPVSLIKRYEESDKELFPYRNKPKIVIPVSKEDTEDKTISLVLRQKEILDLNNRYKLYLVRYKGTKYEDEWVEEKSIPNNLLRTFRAQNRSDKKEKD